MYKIFSKLPLFTIKYQVNSVFRMVATIMALCAVTFICVQPQVSNDFWLQAKVGEMIVHNGAIPTTLVFPFTEAQWQPFNAHEWLPSVFFYFLIQVFGEKGLPLMLGFFGLALFSMTTWFASQRGGGNFALGLLCGLVALFVENYRHYLRPELFALFLFIVCWQLVDTFKRKPTSASAVGILLSVILWANTHGSFVLGPILVAIYAAGAGVDHLWRKDTVCDGSTAPASFFLLLFAATLACCLINPAGLDLLRFVFDFGHSSIAKEVVVEWFPTLDSRIRKMPGIWIALGCVCGVVGLSVGRWRRIGTVDLFIFLFFLVLGFSAVRFLVYQGFVAAFLLPVLWSDYFNSVMRQRALYALTALLGGLVLTIAAQFGNANGNFPHWSNSAEPLSAPMIDILSNPTFQGNVYNSYDLGAELVYRAYPRLRPSIDSRIDSYGDDYFSRHESLLTDASLMNVFITKHNVRFMLLTHDDFNSLRPYFVLPNSIWLVRAADSRAVFLERSGL